MYRQIEDTNYEINNNGDVRNIKTGKTLKPQPRGNYLKVSLSSGNVVRQLSVHRLVARYFCEMRYGCSVVDHIDRNPHNNNSNNLRWVTEVENSRNGVRVHNLPDYIYRDKYSNKDGDKFLYSYRRYADGVSKRLKSSTDLKEVIKFKKEYEKNLKTQ